MFFNLEELFVQAVTTGVWRPLLPDAINRQEAGQSKNDGTLCHVRRRIE